MNRKIKNIIIIILIAVLAVVCFFTQKATQNSISMEKPSGDDMSQGQMGTPPDMQNDNSNTTANGEMSTPPEKPDDNSNTTSGETQTPPEKPEGETNTTGSEMTAQQQPNFSNSDLDENIDSQMQVTPENGMFQNDNNMTKSISTTYYIIFAVEALAISILLIYLVMSNFNKKTLKETLNGTSMIIVYIVLIVALTIVLTFAQIYIANNLTTTNEQEQNQTNMQMPGGNNSGSTDIAYTGVEEITQSTTVKDETYSSTNSDENAVLVSGDIDVTLEDVTVTKTGDSDGGDNSNFYGNNSGIIAKDGADLTIENSTITTDADGANGVFSYGGSATTNNSSSDGTTVTISDSVITTTGDNAGGIMTTGGGTTNASNLTINTSGTSSAAIRSDRGGGTVNVDGGTYTTDGTGSPAIYSTADITVKNSKLISNASEGIVIEGANTVTIENCDLTDSNTKLNGQSTTYKNVFLYQSMSGDAMAGTATFTASNSSIVTNNGDSFYVTNTTATINLTNNTIVNNDITGNLLRIQKDSWGTSGSNGGDVTLIMTNQDATGNIVVDSISTLDMTMKSNSNYEGTINQDNSAESIKLTLDATSTIKLTGDSYVTELEDADTSYSNIDFNGYKLYVNGVAIN